VLNKWDTMPAVKNVFEAVSDRIHFLFGQMEYAPIIAISALNGNGIDELLSTSLRMYDQLRRRIETAALNRALEKWLDEYQPPTGKQTRFKIRYAVQPQANKFVFFVSRPHAVSESYIAFLRNRIRRDLGFSLVPVIVELRPSAKEERPGFKKKKRR
jgi:GTP-binding protein